MNALQEKEDRLYKLREERLAREKARIQKLRELNIKKYGETKTSTTNLSVANKPIKSETTTRHNPTGPVKNNFHVNGTTKRPISAPIPKPQPRELAKPKSALYPSKIENKVITAPKNSIPERKPLTAVTDKKVANVSTSKLFPDKVASKAHHCNLNMPSAKKAITNSMARKSLAMPEKPKINQARKSLAPTKPPQSATKKPANSNDVFERLYKPKPHHPNTTDVEKLRTDPNYLKKVIRTTGLILNKRHTVFEGKPKIAVPVRRSISAVHFKRIGKQELGNCVHKWASIGESLNKLHVEHINEDDAVKQDKVVSAVKSERKKVKFLTPVTNFNTPRPEELQARLKSWLQKRGKSLDSYHHLQCFGIHHLPHHLRFDPKQYDDENKENIAVESDSDDESYTENINEEVVDMNNKWRTASIVSDSIDFNESQNTTTTCSDAISTDEVLTGALNDLTELLKEGFDWEQCARWLRAIRERFPAAPNIAAYWECRAALEETRGDLPASVQCWEEAIAKGTEHSVVEANLDQLLDKFMQLKISPNSNKARRQVDPKLVDVKNVFKSTIIRFAVQQAKLRQSNPSSPAPTPAYCVTPVRRSSRLSCHWTNRTPLQCASVKQASEQIGQQLHFVPNQHLHGTP